MIKTYLTQKHNHDRHVLKPSLVQNVDNHDIDGIVQINTTNTHQTILGFGGAFTEAACYTLSKLSTSNRRKVLNAYFDPESGLNYTLGRMHMNSCDFSLENYTYVDDKDVSLESFDISREHRWVIPTIKEAERIAKKPIKMLISPWSPPAWMKTNDDMNHGGKLKEEYASVWADYYNVFLSKIKQAGVTPFALTVQNEPAAKQTWDSCLYTAEEERDFVRDHLGPTIKEGPHRDTKILVWDHNRDIIFDRASPIYDDPKASQYVWGAGFHWYVSEAFENLNKVKKAYPDKHLLFTEGCIEDGPQPGVYENGERYARHLIGDFRNGSEGFIDWNLTLDEHGGPNHVGNYCDAPILSYTEKDEILFNPSYYHIAHFSKHIRPGAVMVESQSIDLPCGHVALKNPDGSIAFIIQNEKDNQISIKVELDDEDLLVDMPPRSLMTIIKDEGERHAEES